MVEVRVVDAFLVAWLFVKKEIGIAQVLVEVVSESESEKTVYDGPLGLE